MPEFEVIWEEHVIYGVDVSAKNSKEAKAMVEKLIRERRQLPTHGRVGLRHPSGMMTNEMISEHSKQVFDDILHLLENDMFKSAEEVWQEYRAFLQQAAQGK